MGPQRSRTVSSTAHPARRLAAVAAVVALATTGCSVLGDDAEAGDETPAAAPTAPSSTTPTPSQDAADPDEETSDSPDADASADSDADTGEDEEPEPVGGSPSQTPTEAASPTAPPGGTVNKRLPDRLLTAEQLPGFSDEWTWQEGRTARREGRDPFGTCHEFAMTSIGATRVVTRDYSVGAPGESGEGSSASHLVAEFADDVTARRAHDVLRAWRSECRDNLRDYQRAEVGGLRPVHVAGPAGADAGWYLLTYGPPANGDSGSAYFDAQGTTRVGTRVSVLQMRVVGQDYNYPRGEEPMVEAVRTATGELG